MTEDLTTAHLDVMSDTNHLEVPIYEPRLGHCVERNMDVDTLGLQSIQRTVMRRPD